jgi:hypothetical protein
VLAIASITDELLTNAVYHAPTDETGEYKYAHVDRQTKIVLESDEEASLSFGSDGYTLAISVVDNFGSLTLSRIRSHLLACVASNQIEQKAGGAGIGLCSVLQQCDELIVNIDPGRRTEMIALIDLRRTSKVPRASLQVSCVHTAASVGTGVTLCASLRRELCSKVTESKNALSFASSTTRRVASGTGAPPDQVRPQVGTPPQLHQVALPLIEDALPLIEDALPLIEDPATRHASP